MNAALQHELVVRGVELVQSELGRVLPGGLISGLREDSSYVLEVAGCERRLYVDDVPLIDRPAGQFAWASGFFAGRVEVVSVCPKGTETSYFLEVAPASQKAREDQFASMIEAIRKFDQRLLLGETAACLGFGRDGSGGNFDNLVRWERLRRHGRSFLKYVEAITRSPHASLRPMRQSLSLAQVKRLPVTALHDRRIVALATGQFLEGENVDSIQVNAQIPVATVDTPANRAIHGLLKRFHQALVELQAWAIKHRTGPSETDVVARCNRRLEILRTYDAEVRHLLNCSGQVIPDTTIGSFSAILRS